MTRIKTRECSKCQKNKPLDDKHYQPVRSKGKVSFRNQCRVCRSTVSNSSRSSKQQIDPDLIERLLTEAEEAGAENASDPEATAEGRAEQKRRAHAEQKRKEQAARLASDHDPLRPEDFDVSIGNDGRIDPAAAREKRQEYSRSMGEYASALHNAVDGDVPIPEHLGAFIGNVAEQERRYRNRQLARSVSLASASDYISLLQFKQAAKQYLSDKITPTGYALKKPDKNKKRTVCLFLSDLHLGSDLSGRDNPIPFGPVEEARRLEYIVRQAMDFKLEHRDQSELLLLLNGDLIEGYLLHDLRDGAPLAEQKVIFWRLFREIIGLLSRVYPSMHIECQVGNHGRDRLRTPGRAASRKFDGHEWEMYFALSQMCSSLKNVTFSFPFKAVSFVDLHGSTLLMTHGDTEIKLGDPDTKAQQNAANLDHLRSSKIYGREFQLAVFGHYHKPRYIPGAVDIIWNGCLLPPNGYARTSGYTREKCGQWMWEAVEGFPIGDLRFIEVGTLQDRDERLGGLIHPFRFD